MDIEDVLKAWTFWEKTLIRKRIKDSENMLDYDVEFVMLKDKLYGKSKPGKNYRHETEGDLSLGDAEVKRCLRQSNMPRERY